MSKKAESRAKKIRDVGKTSVHFKVQDSVAEKFTLIIKKSGLTKQQYLENHVMKLVEGEEPQLRLNL